MGGPRNLIILITCLILSIYVVKSVPVPRTYEVLTPSIDQFSGEWPIEFAKVSALTLNFVEQDGTVLVLDGIMYSYKLKQIRNGNISVIMDGKGSQSGDFISSAKDLQSARAPTIFAKHPINGNLVFYDPTYYKIRMLNSNRTVSTIANLTSIQNVFAFDVSGRYIYLGEQSTNSIKKLDLLSRNLTTIVGANYNTSLKGYVEGQPGNLAKFYPISILHTGQELYFSNGTVIAKLDSKGIFKTILGPKGEVKATISSPVLLDYVAGDLYFLEGSSRNLCVLSNGIVKILFSTPYTMGATNLGGGEWLISSSSSIKLFNSNTNTTTDIFTAYSGVIASPKYPAYIYGIQNTLLVGIQRNGDYILASSNSFYIMSRNTGILSKLLEWPTAISKYTIDHATDDIYFSEVNGTMSIVYHFMSKERQLEVFAGSSRNLCDPFEKLSGNSSNLCLFDVKKLTLFKDYLYVADYGAFRILKIHIPSRKVENVAGIGLRFSSVSGIGSPFIGTKFPYPLKIIQNENGEIYGASGPVVIKIDSFSPNSTVQHVAGVNFDSLLPNRFYNLAFHPITKQLYHVNTNEKKEICLYVLSEGIDRCIKNLSYAGEGLAITSNNITYIGSENGLFEYNMKNNILTKLQNNEVRGICLSVDEKYLISTSKAGFYIYTLETRTFSSEYLVTSLGFPISKMLGVYCHPNGLLYIAGATSLEFISPIEIYTNGFVKFNITSRTSSEIIKGMSVVNKGYYFNSKSYFIVKTDEEIYYSDIYAYRLTPNKTELYGGQYFGGYASNTVVVPSAISISTNGDVFFDVMDSSTRLWKVDASSGMVSLVAGNGTLDQPMFWDKMYDTDISQISIRGDLICKLDGAFSYDGANFDQSDTKEKVFLIPGRESLGNGLYASVDGDFYGAKGSSLIRLLYDCGQRDQYGHCQNITTSQFSLQNSSLLEFNTSSNSSNLNNSSHSLNSSTETTNITTNHTSTFNSTDLLNDILCINETCSLHGKCYNSSCNCEVGYFGLYCELSCDSILSNKSACSVGNTTVNNTNNNHSMHNMTNYNSSIFGNS